MWQVRLSAHLQVAALPQMSSVVQDEALDLSCPHDVHGLIIYRSTKLTVLLLLSARKAAPAGRRQGRAVHRHSLECADRPPEAAAAAHRVGRPGAVNFSSGVRNSAGCIRYRLQRRVYETCTWNSSVQCSTS